MKRIILILFILFPIFIFSENWIKKEGENLTIVSRVDSTHIIEYQFKKCMANNLYTFYKVMLIDNNDNKRVLNEAISDNIGPFEIKNGGWCGGNHLYKDNISCTAQTFNINISVNGRYITNDTSFMANDIEINVENYIFNPKSSNLKDGKYNYNDTLCIENVNYIIDGNSIIVETKHHYINKIPVEIHRYYGMQSMFNGEMEILTPLGEYNIWTPIDSIDRFKKQDFPLFNQFIEKNNDAYQATWLLNVGLGSHNEVNDSDVVFIGNSWSKSYHKLIGDKIRKKGDYDSWKGIYTWGAYPVIDNKDIFSYFGRLKGKDALFINILRKGEYKIKLSDNIKDRKMSIMENNDDIIINNRDNFIYFKSLIPASAIIIFDY